MFNPSSGSTVRSHSRLASYKGATCATPLLSLSSLSIDLCLAIFAPTLGVSVPPSTGPSA